MARVLDWYSMALKAVTVALLTVMVALVFTNVVLRYAFNSGIAMSEELARWAFVWLTFLGSIHALREGHHLGTDMVLDRLPPGARKAALLAGHGLMLGVCWLLFSGALFQTRLNWTTTAPTSGLTVGWFYLAGVVFAVSAALVLVERMLRIAFVPPREGERP